MANVPALEALSISKLVALYNYLGAPAVEVKTFKNKTVAVQRVAKVFDDVGYDTDAVIADFFGSDEPDNTDDPTIDPTEDAEGYEDLGKETPLYTEQEIKEITEAVNSTHDWSVPADAGKSGRGRKAAALVFDPAAVDENWTVAEVGKNPKSRGAAKRFDLYKVGQTVGQYLDASTAAFDRPRHAAMADVRWDSQRGFIRLTPPAKAAG